MLTGVRILETSLYWARIHAVTTNSPLRLIIEEEGKCFYWEDRQNREILSQSKRILPRRVRIVASPRSPLCFYQHGNAAPAGSFVLQNNAGTCRVVVNLRGRIRVQRDGD